MAVNTNQQNDGKFVTTSSISVVGGPSRSTLQAEDLVATSVLSTALLTVSTLTVVSTASVGGAVTLQGNTTSSGTITTLALSGTRLFSSATTNQSASTVKVANGQIVFSILSLTTNGAAMFFRSGNSTYVFESSGVIG